MRIVVLAGLAVGAIAVFAPGQGAGLMRSVVHGLGWGIGREIAHNIFWPSPLVTAIAESPGTLEEDGRADLQQRIGNGKDPPEAGIDHRGRGLASFEAAPNLNGNAQYHVICGPQFWD